MSSIDANDSKPDLSRALVMLLAISTGVSVASIYYCQPLLSVIGASLHAPASSLALIPTLTQLGYAAGILLLAPLGDRYDRKKVILLMSGALLVSLILAALAQTSTTMLIASFLVGIAATVAQQLVPAAATLAPEESRGKTVGKVMTGLLLGILLSRVVSGIVAEAFGWRAVFVTAGISMVAVVIALWKYLPQFTPTSDLPYRRLIASLGELWVQHRSLRFAAAAQGLVALAFSAFWSTLSLLLSPAPFHFGTAAVGTFGLAGVAGALAAPLAGSIADRRGPGIVTKLGSGLVAISFVLMALVHLPHVGLQIFFLALTAIAFDLGVQATLIAHQSIIYSIDPQSRSRLNAILLFGVFVGMSSGSAIAGVLIPRFGWNAVPVLAAIAGGLAWTLRMRAERPVMESSSAVQNCPAS